MFRAAVLACNRPDPKLGQLLPGRGGSLFALSHLLFGPDPMAGLTPQQRRKVPSRSYWASAQADLRALHSIPVLHESISLGPRTTGATPLPSARTQGCVPTVSPRSPPLLPRVALPVFEMPSPPKPPSSPPRTSETVALQTLEEWLRSEIAPLPRTAPHRLTAFRHVFNELIAQLPAHGRLLAEVKQEYERALADATAEPAAVSSE